MIKELNCGTYSVKVFQDNRLFNSGLILPNNYMVYIKNYDNDIVWISNELDYDIIKDIKTKTLIIVNMNPKPIPTVLFSFIDKSKDIELLKYIAYNCQHISIGLNPDMTMINAEYCYICDYKSKIDNIYLLDYFDIISDDFINYNLSYEEI